MPVNRIDLGSRRAVQIFVAAWVLFSAFFATNVEREHYPAFALVDHHDLRVDEYAGFHPDIFVHTDGHAYVGNNVITSLFAAVPLYLLDAPLDFLEIRRRSTLGAGEAPSGEYRTYDNHPNRKAFFERVTQQGLDLRFGGATAITTGLFMAPLSALMLVLFFQMLRGRGLSEGRATTYAFLLGFATPIFFRTSALSHNMVTMYATFGAFWLLWPREAGAPASLGRRTWAGLLAGIALATDYSGVVPLLALYGYLVGVRWKEVGFLRSFRESIPFVLGSVPPVAFLLFSQWAMFRNPFLPGQYWMPDVSYTDRGWRGFAWPAPDLFLLNLFSPRWGMVPFAPLLALGLLPAWRYARDKLVIPRPERWFIAAFVLAYLVFCAANQYSRMQWNTGFRYLLPIVPFLFMTAVDHLQRLPRNLLRGVAAAALIHSWVIASVREQAFSSWAILFRDGVQLPWLTVLRMTRPEGTPVLSSAWLPPVLLTLVGLATWWMWRRLASTTAGGGEV
ncbi:MAG: hypothetical protein R3E10_01755 [Gemmatimonadota bacterium]